MNTGESLLTNPSESRQGEIMKKRNWIVVLLAIVIWSFMAKGIAQAQPPYVNCSTGAPPYAPTTVAFNSSQEAQVFCNGSDIAIGGGYEVLSPSLPLTPPSFMVIVPENSFHFNSTNADGWQVVLQNVNLLPSCIRGSSTPFPCPAVQFRVCVSCQPE